MDAAAVRRRAFIELLARSRKAKLNFLAELRGEGLVVMTNIVFVAGDERDPILLDTHIAQEVALARGGAWVPRNLADPVQLGRYVLFLIDDITEKLPKSLNKAAKRAYALARLLSRDDDADAISNTLRADDAFLIAALQARLDIARAIAALDDEPLRKQLVPLIVSTLGSLCDRGVDPQLRTLSENGKHLDDLSSWINNLDQYMQKKKALGRSISGFLGAFVEDIRNQVAGA